jgi:hypothetical protein
MSRTRHSGASGRALISRGVLLAMRSSPRIDLVKQLG